MAAIIRVLTRPQDRRPGPPPAPVNLRATILVGMGLWTVALAVAGILVLMGRKDAITLAYCAAGLALGCIGLWWDHGNRRRTAAAETV
jgi:hypothetical protein